MDVEGQEKLVEEQGLEAGRNFGVGMTTVLATAVVWTAAACGARVGVWRGASSAIWNGEACGVQRGWEGEERAADAQASSGGWEGSQPAGAVLCRARQ